MPLYHLYFFSRKSGDIAHTYRFRAADDRAAINFAAVWDEDAPMELWRDGDRLCRWDQELAQLAAA